MTLDVPFKNNCIAVIPIEKYIHFDLRKHHLKNKKDKSNLKC